MLAGVLHTSSTTTYNVIYIAVAIAGFLGAWWKRKQILAWFKRGGGPVALTETLKTVEALEGRVEFLTGELSRVKEELGKRIDRLTEENKLLRRENDNLTEQVTSRAAVEDLTKVVNAGFEKVLEAVTGGVR